jgi:hypothetical protein
MDYKLSMDNKQQQIDFKRLSKSEGYIKLKAAVLKDIFDRRRSNPKKGCFNLNGCDKKSKRECFNNHCSTFKYVIDLIRKVKHITGIDEVIVINAWEAKRSFWYMNFYQDSYLKDLINIAQQACASMQTM